MKKYEMAILFSRICFESGKSSIESWQTGSENLIKIYDILTHTDGVYGGRFSGAGFNGCSMAIIDPAYRESIIENLTSEYIKCFPKLKDKFSVHICNTSDGVKL